MIVVPPEAQDSDVFSKVGSGEVEEGEPRNGVLGGDEECAEYVRAAENVPCAGHQRGCGKGAERPVFGAGLKSDKFFGVTTYGSIGVWCDERTRDDSDYLEN